MFSSALVCVFVFVCWQDYAKTTRRIFTKFGRKMAHGPQGPRKKALDFGGKPDHVTLGLVFGYG